MIIHFSCSWCDDNQLKNRILRNFTCPENISLTTEGDFDYFVSFNYPTDTRWLFSVGRSKCFCFTMEPSTSQHIKNIEFDDFNKVFHHTKTHDNVIETATMVLYHMTEDKSYFNNIKKSKKLSFVVSNLRGSQMYDFRTSLAEKMLETDVDFDMFGYGWNICDSRYKGPMASKSIGLVDYEYSIAIENSIEKNYSTEKISDCFVCDTIPIYYGCPNIDDIYDTRSFVSLDISNPIEHIRQIIKSEKLKNPSYAKDQYNTKYNILNFCSNELNKYT